MNDRVEKFSGFYRLDIAARLERLVAAGVLSSAEARELDAGGYVLSAAAADRMIENVIGVLGLPLAVVGNLRVNQRDYLVPMAVEEPSIVAAASAAAALVRRAGGFLAVCEESQLIGQIELRRVRDTVRATQAITAGQAEVVAAANAVHPNMLARGGGARSLVVRAGPHAESLLVHLHVDTRDAMGANVVNEQCEAVAPLLEKISGGEAGLKILSNLTDRSIVRASVALPHEFLRRGERSGVEVRDAIVAADRLAATDVYRAVTHNKGIMNGIDPIAIATGNDWRAIEAGAHAYAARSGHYRGLTVWSCGESGELLGRIEIPLKPGIVGASIAANRSVELALGILGVGSAIELAEVMAAVGLAQNFAALRALGTEGIQRGHMRLHARQVAAAAEVSGEAFDTVVDRLIASGDIKEWKAREIHRELLDTGGARSARVAEAAGKIILVGEHAVVHGAHALAVPIPAAMRATVTTGTHGGGIRLHIPRWGVDVTQRDADPLLQSMLSFVTAALGLDSTSCAIEIDTRYPRGVGLGGSATLSVVVARALAGHYEVDLDDEAVNGLALRTEQYAHGNPSGIDNTVASYGRAVVYRRAAPPLIEFAGVGADFELVVALSSHTSSTATMVDQVARLATRRAAAIDKIFTAIDALVLDCRDALARGDIETIGELMNINHGLLAALGVSTTELDRLCGIARSAGALGAKLTGAGGGGAMVAVCAKQSVNTIARALASHCASTFTLPVRATD